MGKKKGKGGSKPSQTQDEIPDYLLAEQDLLEVVHQESDAPNNTEDVNTKNKNTQNDNNAQNGKVSESSTGTQKETKGQMLQRHKKEMKDLKQHTQEMLHHQENHDKKSKQKLLDTIKKMEDDLKVKHEKELQTVDEDEQVEQVTQGVEDMMQKKETQKSNKKKAKKASKQTQELEREKRIAMEKANQVSMKDVENNMFAKKLHPIHLTIKQVPSDGNCLYAAVADQLVTNGQQTTKDYYRTLRRMTAEYMKAHPDDFLPFIDHEDGIMSEQQYAEYCDNVANTSCWGGQPELKALVHALQTPILVYSAEANVPTVEMGKEFEAVNKPLQISYHRHAYTQGEHYNSVVPLVESEE